MQGDLEGTRQPPDIKERRERVNLRSREAMAVFIVLNDGRVLVAKQLLAMPVNREGS